MNRFHHCLLPILLLPLAVACHGSSSDPIDSIEPFGPVPTLSQLEWQRMEINMFCHFGPNTFSGAEWGDGTEPEDLFNPRALDCRQWVEVAEQAGMQGIILTAKHHDGFCLWPSAQSTHTVAQSSWNEGHGDVLRAFTDACRGRVKAGVYISPWDRNHPTYGSAEYNEVFVNTLCEVHTAYGPMFEQWFDGACGEGPNGKQQHYDWPRFMQTMNKLNHNTIIFSDIGPGCRWVGNEEGRAGETCWSTLNTEGATPSDNKPSPEVLTVGHQGGSQWVPAEVDVSIRPGWFWHPNEHPKSVDELMEIYFNSVGHNGLLLLNVPPDTNGRICAEDSAVLAAFRAERDRIFSKDVTLGGMAHGKHLRGHQPNNVLDTAYHTYWAASSANDTLYIGIPDAKAFDIIMLQEYIPLGQRVAAFHVDCWQPCRKDGSWQLGWVTIAEGTTIGYKRLLRIPTATSPRLRIVFDSVLAAPVINRIALFNSKDK